MARSIISHLSTRERKHASVGVGVGGLVALDVLDREKEANATAAAAAVGSNPKSLGRVPLALSVPSTGNVSDTSPAPSAKAYAESVLSSPSSGNKSGVSSRRSISSPSTVASPLSPLNKPLPPRPRRRSSPGLPSLPELPGSLPRPLSTTSVPIGSEQVMGVLVPEPATLAQMERSRIRRTTSDLGSSDFQAHRRKRNASPAKHGRELSPTPTPGVKQSKTSPVTRQGSAGERDQPDSPAVAGKKRDSSGHPVQAGYPMTPDDIGIHRAMTTDAVQVERDTLARTLSETQGQIEAALGQLSRSQASVRMLKAQLSTSEARLEDSNSQRVDALEQNLFLEERLRHALKARSSSATAPADQKSLVESRPMSRLLQAEEKVELLEQQLATAHQQNHLSPVVTELTERLLQHEQYALEKDRYIKELLEQNNSFRVQLETFSERLQTAVETNEALRATAAANKGLLEAQEAASARLTHLERIAAEQEAQLNKATAEKAQLSGLLEGEIRRQAVISNNLEHPNASQLGAFSDTEQTMTDVKAKVNKKAAQDMPVTSSGQAESSDQQIRRLQKEINYHVQDIVLYKLDVKGYKKDLKRANAKIKKLADAETPRQTLTPRSGGPSASPALSCVSAATSSTPTSAYPRSPSPSTHATLNMSLFAPSPPPSESFPTPRATTASPGPRSPNSNVPQGIAALLAPLQKSASSTPSTPTKPAAVQPLAATRQRSQTGPALSFVPPKNAVHDHPMPSSSHQRSRSDITQSMQPVEADSRPAGGNSSHGNGSTDADTASATDRAAAEPSKHESSPPRAIDTHKGQSRPKNPTRNSLDVYGDVPNGGLPPIQMWNPK